MIELGVTPVSISVSPCNVAAARIEHEQRWDDLGLGCRGRRANRFQRGRSMRGLGGSRCHVAVVSPSVRAGRPPGKIFRSSCQLLLCGDSRYRCVMCCQREHYGCLKKHRLCKNEPTGQNDGSCLTIRRRIEIRQLVLGLSYRLDTRQHFLILSKNRLIRLRARSKTGSEADRVLRFHFGGGSEHGSFPPHRPPLCAG